MLSSWTLSSAANHAGKHKLTFAYPSTQQHLLIWKRRPQTAMVFMKLGNSLLGELLK